MAEGDRREWGDPAGIKALEKQGDATTGDHEILGQNLGEEGVLTRQLFGRAGRL